MQNIVIYRGGSRKIRLDWYLLDVLKNMSRSHIQSLIRNENILVNGRKVKTGYLLCQDDELILNLPDPKKSEIKPENIPLDIYYEDNDVIVVNKPKGMVVHPSYGHFSGTLVNALLYHCKDSLSGVNGVLRPGIVHRIDKDTTGLIIACKNDRAHNIISKQLSTHTMGREYVALCYGRFKESSFVVDAPIGRNKKQRKKMVVMTGGNGRKAITHVEVSENLGPSKMTLNQPLSLIKCVLETGRTHQIRVHMRYLRHPLAGDEVYGIKKDPLRGQGQYLHAAKLSFSHPVTGKRLQFEAPIPWYFKETLEKLRKTGS